MFEKTIPQKASSYKIPYIVLYISEILLVLLLIPGCLKAPLLTASFGRQDFTYQEAESGISKYIGNGIDLTPGVYQIRIRGSQDNVVYEQALSNIDIALDCEDKTFRSLRGNTVRFYFGQNDLTFEYYVSDRLSDVRVICVPLDEHGIIDAIEQIDIYKTSAGNRIVLTCLLLFIIVVNGLLHFRRRILEGKVSLARTAAFWGLAGIAAIAIFPYLTDYLIMGTDTPLYLIQIEDLAQNPQNILKCAAQGSILLYIPALLRNIGFSVMTAYKISAAMLTISAVFISYKAIYKCVADEYAALLGSMAYILFPWPIDLMYSDGSIGLYIVFATFPLVFSGIWNIAGHNMSMSVSRTRKGALWHNLCFVIIGVLFMAQGIILDSTVISAGTINVMALMPLILPAALSVLLSVLYIKLKRHRKEFFFIMAVFLLISAIYRVNDIAFCSNVYYLYDIGQLKRGVQP